MRFSGAGRTINLSVLRFATACDEACRFSHLYVAILMIPVTDVMLTTIFRLSYFHWRRRNSALLSRKRFYDVSETFKCPSWLQGYVVGTS